MPTNTADRKDIRRREKQSAIEAAQLAAVTREIMSTTQGRAWMWHHLSQANLFSPNTISDLRLSGIFDGERNFGLRLLADIMSTCPDQFIQAMREANVRDATSERRSSPQHHGRDSGRETGADEGNGDYGPYEGLLESNPRQQLDDNLN